MKIIYDITLRSDRTDRHCKDRLCQGSFHDEENATIFEMEQTKRWFTLDSFIPKEGYRLIPEGSPFEYVITKVEYETKRPKRTIFTAQRVNPA